VTTSPLDPLLLGDDPFTGFDVQVLADRAVYAPGETVRFTVTATNHGPQAIEHHYPGWQRYHLSVRDEGHRVVADDVVARDATQPAIDRWLPGQMLILPTYWGQTSGPVVPAWTNEPPGPRVPPGRYRARVTWLGRVPGRRGELPDAWSRWFDLG
jgi:hypothetical protein